MRNAELNTTNPWRELTPARVLGFEFRTPHSELRVSHALSRLRNRESARG